jgi:UDP:flavonoid glycosyltransferase YjiC (YdhE family)
MRVLFHAPPLLGHTLPMVPLARALRDQGHAVAWAAAGDAAAWLLRQGFAVHETGPDRTWAAAELARQWPERHRLSAAEQVAELGPRLFASVYAPATLEPLRALVQQWQPGCLVHDVMAHAAPLAAALAGVRSVSHGFGLPRPRESMDGAAARMAPLWQARGLEMPADCGNHRDGHVDICPPSMRLGEPVPDGPRWPLSPASGVQRRQGARHGVLASFGTVHNRQATFDRLLAVLLQGPWPVRAALGRPLEPAQAWPPHVHAAAWLDLADEWARCRVGACHGGAGTMLGALAQGVPLLLLPVAADQFRNARALQAVGAGIALAGEAQTESAMADALQRLHDEPAFGQAAARVADELAAMPQAEAVARALVA